MRGASTTINAGEPDASNLNIPDESVSGLATYEWNLNNDGDFNDVVSSSPIVTDRSVTLPGASSVDEGSAYVLTIGGLLTNETIVGGTVDPGDDTLSGYTDDWGDSQTETFTGTPNLKPTHTYADGNATITITVSRLSDEDDGYTDVATLDVTVRAVAPTIELTGVPASGLSRPFELLLGEITDLGEDTVSEYRIYWGDGSTFDGNAYQPVPVNNDPLPVLLREVRG